MGRIHLARGAHALPALLIIIALAACARPGGTIPASPVPTGEATAPDASRPPFDTLPPEESVAPITGEVPDDVMAAILADAERRSGVAASEMEARRAEAVTWNDGSLGCPEPGQVYTQALIDGYHVVLEADGERLDYRVGASGSFRLCDAPGVRPPGSSGDA